MASPTDTDRATSGASIAQTPVNINLPATPGLQAGDLAIVCLRIPANITTTWPSGWTNFLNDGTNTWHDIDLDAGDDRISVVARDCDGSEGTGQLSVTPSASCKYAAIVYRIAGARSFASQSPDILSAIGNSANPDCPSESVTGGPKDILSLALDTHVGEQTTTVTYPTSYTNTGQVTTGSGGAVATNCQINFCSRQLTAASSEDPSAFTISGANPWTALTILIQEPAAAAAASLVVPTGIPRALLVR
jgi:hypothetical protein